MDDSTQNIIWLASYPKSGNTWFRAFLSALLNDGKVAINEMKTDGIFSSRQVFDSFTDIDAENLNEEELQLLHPQVFTQVAANSRKKLYVKIHDAYTFNTAGKPIVPTEPTQCAVYIIRNPLDIAASLANHNRQSLDAAIAALNNPDHYLNPSKTKFLDQVPQFTGSWSYHVESWLSHPPFPVMCIRYEDLLESPVEHFTRAVAFLKLDATAAAIEKAVTASSFDKLKEQEDSVGFSEATNHQTRFFRKGHAGGWKDELSATQADNIVTAHSDVMKKFGY